MILNGIKLYLAVDQPASAKPLPVITYDDLASGTVKKGVAILVQFQDFSLAAKHPGLTLAPPRYFNPPLPGTPTPLPQVLQPPSPRYSNPPLPGTPTPSKMEDLPGVTAGNHSPREGWHDQR